MSGCIPDGAIPTTRVICTCEELMTYEPPHPAEPDTDTREWLGGWTCSGCGRSREDEEPEPFCESTGPWPIDERKSV